MPRIFSVDFDDDVAGLEAGFYRGGAFKDIDDFHGVVFCGDRYADSGEFPAGVGSFGPCVFRAGP